MKKFHKFCVGTIMVLFSLILIWLLVLSGFSTSFISPDGYEHTYLVKDSIALNLLVAAVVFFVCYFFKEKTKLGIWFEKIEKEELLYEKCKRILLLVILALGVLWVLFTQCIPRADQDSVLLAAWGLKVGDYHMFEKSGYLAAFPHQSGLVLLLYLCSFLFGDYNYVAFQLMNAVFIMLTYRELEKISGYFGVKKVTRLAVLLCGILFFPLILYASFVYGMVPGLFWAVLSMRDTIAFCREQHIKQAVIAAVSIMFAVMLKSNYLIFFIGISVYLFFGTLKAKKSKICVSDCMYGHPLYGAVSTCEKVFRSQNRRKYECGSIESFLYCNGIAAK